MPGGPAVTSGILFVTPIRFRRKDLGRSISFCNRYATGCFDALFLTTQYASSGYNYVGGVKVGGNIFGPRGM